MSFNFYYPYLVPGLLDLANKNGFDFRDFEVSNETSDRLESGDDSVYYDIMKTYLDALKNNAELVIV